MPKHITRSRLRRLLAALPETLCISKSTDACRKLCEIPEFQNASVVMLFLPLPGEIDISRSFHQAFQNGKSVLVPRVNWQIGSITPVKITALDCPMQQDRYGLRFPIDTTSTPPSAIDLVVVPGLGFDERGNRLGRGGGHYDRFLGNGDFRGTVCGFGFEEQLVKSIPKYDHDVLLDLLVTDHVVRRFS